MFMPGTEKEKKQWHQVNLLILSGLILTILASVVTYNGENRWVGHAVAGVFSLILIITLMTTGGMLTGRLRSWEHVRIFPVHRTVSIWFSIFVIGSFLFGLGVTALQGKPALTSAHGLLGLVVAVLAAVQLIPSLVMKNRASVREVHRIVGYLLAPLVTLQVIGGLYAAVIGTGREIALLHSLTGGCSVLLFSWIIVEMQHPGKKSLYRARLAAYLGALLTVAGCWIIGGYHYLTTYRENVRAIILSGSQPWAHEVIMETKEHIFLFLPVVAILLALGLHSISDEGTGIPGEVRRAVIVTASLALILVILMFAMGAVLSNAALIGQGGGS
jgi:hypothetical protein